MDLRDKNAILTEWVLKLALIFFVASIFFSDFIQQSMGNAEGFRMGFLVKIIIILVFGIALSILEKQTFKIVAFTLIITGALFKLLAYISLPGFNMLHITDVADYILLISVSIYYLFRHFRSHKRKKPTDHHPPKTKKHHKKRNYPRYTAEDVKTAHSPNDRENS